MELLGPGPIEGGPDYPLADPLPAQCWGNIGRLEIDAARSERGIEKKRPFPLGRRDKPVTFRIVLDLDHRQSSLLVGGNRPERGRFMGA